MGEEQVAWDEEQVEDKALRFRVTWALRHCDNNGCYRLWSHLASTNVTRENT